MVHQRRPLRLFLSALASILLLAACSATESSTSESVASVASDDEELVSDADEQVDPAQSDPDATDQEPIDAPEDAATSTTESSRSAAAVVNERMGRGINFGNSLEAPREGDWGIGLDATYFEVVADAGFGHVRLPVSWAGYADTEAPFVIPDGIDSTVDHPDYSNVWERVDWAIDQAEENGLIIIVNMHIYDAIHVDPLAERERFLAMWEQIAERYSDAGDHVIFEILNEPNQTFDVEPRLWNEFATEALAVIRESNPERPVLIGPVGFNSIDRLVDLELPDDPNLVATVHVYEPFEFTHQGATWVEPVPPTGIGWDPTIQTLPPGVFDYSWDITQTPTDAGLGVDYDSQYAGFSHDFQRSVALTEVSFRSSGAADLRVACRLPGGGDTGIETFSTTAESASYSFDLRACSDDSTGIFVQDTSGQSERVTFESLVICSDRGCEEMIQTGAAAIDALFARAADWAAQNNVPMHVGEFGAYGAEGDAPLDDRAAWTRTVQNAAISRDMSTAYWEFHSGFGAWDPNAASWIEPLRSALIG